MIGNIFVLLLSIVLGIGGFIVYQFFQPTTQKDSNNATVTTTPTSTASYSLQDAPGNSLKAEITSMAGEILWQSRTATEPAELKEKVSLQQGEKIVTGNTGNVTLSLGDTIQVIEKKDTMIALTQTLPVNIVFTHQVGTATYIQSANDSPVSIRIRRLLVRMNKGTVTITTEDEDPYIYVNVDKGEVELAYNDEDFTSQLVTVTAGEEFRFNNDKRIGRLQ
ncbi:hypothetical protein BH09PAT2_BH09PAT2_04780 [soil metagenome]